LSLVLVLEVAILVLGWNTWEHLGCGMTENDVKDAAHALVSKGLVKAGYTMLSLDDCW